MTQLSPGYERGFRILFSLSIIILVIFMGLFFILCGYSLGTGEDIFQESILGNFNSVAASLIIIGFPLLFIIFTYVYLQAYKR
tara:strand:- start:364 stop:612 length:249 start_codon:yes stop_codon:yes gene_type:complete